MDGWMHGWMDAWMDGWMNGWMDDWMDGWMDSLIGLMFTAMMSTELEATGHMQREFKRSKGSSGTQEWHLYRFSELMDTHGGKTSTSECNEAALLHFCYIFANDLHCGQWPQSRIDDDKRGSRSEFCNKKVAKRVIKRGKWPPQMWVLPKENWCFQMLLGISAFRALKGDTFIDFRSWWTHTEGKRAQVNATKPHFCIFATYLPMICIVDNGHKVE